jgi:hypothetical protein
MTQGVDLLDVTAANEVMVFGTVEVPPAPPPIPPPPPPTHEFVTITPMVVVVPAGDSEVQQQRLEFWFHPQISIDLEPTVVLMVEEIIGQNPTRRELKLQRQSENVWRAIYGPPPGATTYLTFVFLEQQIRIDGGGPTSLVQLMDQERFSYLNWDPVHKIITAYARLAGVVR